MPREPIGRAHRQTISRRIRRRLDRRLIRLRLASERTLPVMVAGVVLLAGLVSVSPAPTSGVVSIEGTRVRIAIGGFGGPQEGSDPTASRPATSSSLGVYLDDGTMYKPVAVDTTVQSSTGLLRHYTVQSGDTLTAIAHRFGISMMTIWWANDLGSKDELHIGETLVIPPVSGLVVTVGAGDTLESLAAQYKITTASIMAINQLADPILIVGQVIVLPGAQGKPLPTAAPTPKPVAKTTTSSSYSSKVYATSGSWAWPAPGFQYISQYFWSGHQAIDIASDYGNPIVSARAGTVIYAGWNSNCGGYQVWVSHGGGLYTGYYHMSSVLSHVGEYVAKGQQIGRIGMSGCATGPHVHFEVWFGYPWRSGSYRVNPLNYY